MSLIAKEEIVAKISEIAERVARSEGIEIVDVELLGSGRGRVLRILSIAPEPPRLRQSAHTASRTLIANLFRSR
jgi:ribosome maturation factor RimP